jgi:hypothetical protein
MDDKNGMIRMGSFGTDDWMNSFGIWMIRMDNVWEDEVLERNKNLNRGFRKLRVWREGAEIKKVRRSNLNYVNFFMIKLRMF